MRILKPYVARALAVRTNNPRSLSPEDLVAQLTAVGIPAEPAPTLAAAIRQASDQTDRTILICGSLFLAGEALVALDVCPWQADRFDAAEQLVPTV